MLSRGRPQASERVYGGASACAQALLGKSISPTICQSSGGRGEMVTVCEIFAAEKSRHTSAVVGSCGATFA